MLLSKHRGTIKIIIECKKETVDARNAKDGIAQLQSYMSVCPNCEWGCGQIALKSLSSVNIQMRLGIFALWNTTIFLLRMAIWMK